MPIYDYACNDCGPFTEWQSMSLSSKPKACPDCGRRAKRTISAPLIATMDPHRRIAHQRNEKSADQPEVVRKTPHDHGACGQHSHGHSHGHGRHQHGHGPSRPWMIGH